MLLPLVSVSAQLGVHFEFQIDNPNPSGKSPTFLPILKSYLVMFDVWIDEETTAILSQLASEATAMAPTSDINISR